MRRSRETASEDLLLRGDQFFEFRIVLQIREFRFFKEFVPVLEALLQSLTNIEKGAILGARLRVRLR